MKTVIASVFAFLFASVLYAQMPTDPQTGKITYTGIIEQEGTASELYARGKMWISTTFTDSQSVIDLDDKENGTVICKGFVPVSVVYIYSRPAGWVRFVCTLQFKDGRYRYEFTDFYHVGNSVCTDGGSLEKDRVPGHNYFAPEKKWQEPKAQTDRAILAMIETLKDQMSKPFTRNDW